MLVYLPSLLYLKSFFVLYPRSVIDVYGHHSWWHEIRWAVVVTLTSVFLSYVDAMHIMDTARTQIVYTYIRIAYFEVPGYRSLWEISHNDFYEHFLYLCLINVKQKN